jgi:hypothetical protein
MRILSGFGLLAAISALTLGAVAPASAEMFTCHDKPGQVLYSYSGTPDSYRSRRNYSRAGDSSYASTTDYAAHTRYYRAGSSRATYYRSQRYWNQH